MQIYEEEGFTEGAKLLQDATVASCRPSVSDGKHTLTPHTCHRKAWGGSESGATNAATARTRPYRQRYSNESCHRALSAWTGDQ